MLGTRSAIVHDGWTSGVTHYVGLFASFVKNIPAIEEHSFPLLSVNLMVNMQGVNAEDTVEASQFYA